MPVDPNELQALAARIRNADKDPFGLATDGKGHVVAPAGKSFMQLVLDLPQKHLLLADMDHRTTEVLFSQKNSKAMAAAGITHAYLEKNTLEFDFLDQLGRSGQPLGHATKQQIADIAALRKAGITPVASDPRTKYQPDDDATVMRYTLLKDASAISLSLLQQIEGKSAAQLAAALPTLFVCSPAQQKTLHEAYSTMLPMLSEAAEKRKAVDGAQSERYLTAKANIEALTEADKVLQNPSAASVSSISAVLAYHKLAGNMVAVTQPQIDTIAARHLAEAAEANPKLAQMISQLSAHDTKTVARWGIGHMEGTQDLNELLGGRQQAVVVATVASKAEMAEALRTLSGMADKPDYVYMPTYQENGKPVAEQAISVAEYLQHGATPSGPQKPAEKSRGRQ